MKESPEGWMFVGRGEGFAPFLGTAEWEVRMSLAELLKNSLGADWRK